jgi:hypothetical protein
MADIDLTNVPTCSDCKHRINRFDCQSPEIAALSVVFDGAIYKGGMITQRDARWNPGLCSLAGYWFEAR